MVDRLPLRATGRIFHHHFRSFEDVRDAIAHIGDKKKNPEKYGEHSFSGSLEGEGIKATDVKSLTISNHLTGRRYSNTWEGRLVTYEISQISLERLEEAKRHLWAAFRKVETEQRLHMARDEPRTLDRTGRQSWSSHVAWPA